MLIITINYNLYELDNLGKNVNAMDKIKIML